MSSTKDFDQRLLQLWRDAALSKDGIKLSFGRDGKKSLNKAITQRHLLYRVRKTMQTEGHEWNHLAQQCKISIEITLRNGDVMFYSHRHGYDEPPDRR